MWHAFVIGFINSGWGIRPRIIREDRHRFRRDRYRHPRDRERYRRDLLYSRHRQNRRRRQNLSCSRARKADAAGDGTEAAGRESDKSENEPESTLAYLEEKARKDAMEHEMEKREEARRLYESSGGLRPAQRLYEGDSVPNGCKCVACGYCAAENLVPVSSRERFSCYFCREPLDT